MRDELLKLFHQRKKWTLEELRKTLQVKSTKDLVTLIKTLNELVDDRKIANNHSYYFYISSKDVVGKVKDISKYEYAIINPDQKVYVDKKFAKNVFDGDEVLAQYEHGDWKVTQIYTRGIQKVIGEFIHTRNGLVFHSDIDFHRVFKVKNEKAFNIKNHDKAVVKILKYDNPMLVEIEQIVGNAKDKGVDITSILLENRARLVFPSKVEKELNQIQDHVTKKDRMNREDLRDLITFTIDGDDAKDFDDAISIKKKKYGYTLYVHNFFVTEKGDWAVVQQGMNTDTKYARRYHWLNDSLDNFLQDPHTGISCDKKEKKSLNMASKESKEAQKISVDLINDNPNHLRDYFKRKDANQLRLTDFNISDGCTSFSLPAHHAVLDMDLSDKEFQVLKNAWEIQPENYEELLLLKGIGPKKIRALALISDLVFGEPASWNDPVKYTFTHGGKDGFPYPVDRDVYDNSISMVKDAVYQSKLDKKDKMNAFKRLDDFIL